jgi:hypothetical protein
MLFVLLKCCFNKFKLLVVFFVLLKSRWPFFSTFLKCFYFVSNCDDLSSCSFLMLILVVIIFFSYIFIRGQQLDYLMSSYLLTHARYPHQTQVVHPRLTTMYLCKSTHKHAWMLWWNLSLIFLTIVRIQAALNLLYRAFQQFWELLHLLQSLNPLFSLFIYPLTPFFFLF